MKRSFGFVVAGTPQRDPDISTSDGLIESSERHGVMATITDAIARGRRNREGKMELCLVTGQDGTQRVVYGDDLDRAERDRDRRTANKRYNALAAKREFEFSMGKAIAFIEALVEDPERAQEVALAIGEERLRTLWELPKHERRTKIRALIAKQESTSAE